MANVYFEDSAKAPDLTKFMRQVLEAGAQVQRDTQCLGSHAAYCELLDRGAQQFAEKLREMLGVQRG